MIKIGIITDDNYIGGELLRLLVNHPEVEIKYIQNKRHVDKPIAEVYRDLYNETDLVFCEDVNLNEIDLLFFCSLRNKTKNYLASHVIPDDLKIIDFSQQFRWHELFTYGLPELNRRAICTSKYVANPGSLATSISLALLPLAKHLLLNNEIIINSVLGKTETIGQVDDSERNSFPPFNNIHLLSDYPQNELQEIEYSVKQLQNSFNQEMILVPYQGNFNRGIFSSVLVNTSLSIEQLLDIYTQYYERDSFVYVQNDKIELKDVINTNKCFIQLQKLNNKLLVTAAIDNLIKGASGQAIHNMNLLFNLEETTGLHLKTYTF